MRPGDVVVLTLAMVEVDDTHPPRRTRMSGRFELEEFWPYEPANYVHEACWSIRPLDDGPDEGRMDALHRFENNRQEAVTFTISDIELMEQVDPHAYGRMLVLEREMEFAGEEA